MSSAAPTFSIGRHFGPTSAVLLTGASGYVGALVLEKLLRCTDVARVYVLLRPKRGEDVAARLHKLHASPIMHLLRGNPVLDKVVPIAGDMRAPGLGISPEDLRVLQRDVDTVMHAAADIRLEAPVKELLLANYVGTRTLLRLAATFQHLAAFVHISSAYVNMHAEHGSLVKEAIYPLRHGDQVVDDAALVQELLSMPAHNANLRAEGLLKAWGFPNPYCLTKHLSEYMIADFHAATGLPIAIVRPTLISSVARDPYPGFTGNYAGHVGATLAFMTGLFDHADASNYKASNVWDVIPADVVVAVILATAAALGAGLAGSCCATPTRRGRLVEAAAAAAGAAKAPIAVQAFSGGAVPPAAAAAAAAAPEGAAAASARPLLIVHCGSSTLYPLTIAESWNFGIEGYGAWDSRYWRLNPCAGPMPLDHEPDPAKAARHLSWTAWKVWAAVRVLRWLGENRVANKLDTGFRSFCTLNQTKTDVNLRFSTLNMQRLAACLDPSERDDFLLLWAPSQQQQQQPAGAGAGAAAAGAGAAMVPGAAPKFALAAGGAGVAGKLPMGSDDEAGSGSSLVIRAGSPVPSGAGGSSSSSSSESDSAPSPGSSSDSELPDGCPCSGAQARAGGAAAPALPPRGARLGPEQQAALARMRAIPIQWRAFHINLGAFLYVTMFRMAVPPQLTPISNKKVVEWLSIAPEDAWVQHNFELFT